MGGSPFDPTDPRSRGNLVAAVRPGGAFSYPRHEAQPVNVHPVESFTGPDARVCDAKILEQEVVAAREWQGTINQFMVRRFAELQTEIEALKAQLRTSK